MTHAELSTLIYSTIKNNTSGAITGDILQTVLLELLNYSWDVSLSIGSSIKKAISPNEGISDSLTISQKAITTALNELRSSVNSDSKKIVFFDGFIDDLDNSAIIQGSYPGEDGKILFVRSTSRFVLEATSEAGAVRYFGSWAGVENYVSDIVTGAPLKGTIYVYDMPYMWCGSVQIGFSMRALADVPKSIAEFNRIEPTNITQIVIIGSNTPQDNTIYYLENAVVSVDPENDLKAVSRQPIFAKKDTDGNFYVSAAELSDFIYEYHGNLSIRPGFYRFKNDKNDLYIFDGARLIALTDIGFPIAFGGIDTSTITPTPSQAYIITDVVYSTAHRRFFGRYSGSDGTAYYADWYNKSVYMADDNNVKQGLYISPDGNIYYCFGGGIYMIDANMIR